MGLLQSRYNVSNHFVAQDILLAELKRRSDAGLQPADVILYLQGKDKPFEGRLLDVSGNMALLEVGQAHQMIDLDRVSVVTVQQG